ncbi:ABC transporter ATP-binding protein [Sporosarcina contaminans]|uniref:ABC transporter ATP-binding protein n=1 Tax=Sporosarcina contaminans TaxID=633403 RepID=A0ABW3U1M9_9BACL
MLKENEKEVFLKVDNLSKHFPMKKGVLSKQKAAVKAVDGVRFEIYKGETLGVVGESGCGKSTMARLLIKLYEATEGSIEMEGKRIESLNKQELKKFRRDIQMVFQDPYASLNPKWTIKRTLLEPLKVHGIGSRNERIRRVKEILNAVGLNESYAERYPHEFSGGQRQRIGIARALILNPKLIIADEPVSALDISVQAQVINILRELQQEYNLTYLFITHDLSVVEHIADRVIVMYLGRIVEVSTTEKLFEKPNHPYTEALISAVPEVNSEVKKERIILSGDVPDPANPPSGCAFHTRCPYSMEVCKTKRPELQSINEQQQVVCHLYDHNNIIGAMEEKKKKVLT